MLYQLAIYNLMNDVALIGFNFKLANSKILQILHFANTPHLSKFNDKMINGRGGGGGWGA